jgi:hypothetical protein
MNALSRRGLLGSGAALATCPLATAGAPTGGHPDALLLALCAEFIACDLDCRDKGDGPNAIADDGEYEAYNAAVGRRMFSLSLRLVDMPVNTTDGVHGLACCLAQFNGEGHRAFDHPGTISKHLLDAVMRGAMSVGGGVTV